jgi:hypothetical protein
MPEEDGKALENVSERRTLIERDLAADDALIFDPTLSDEEFWRRAAIKPFYAGKRSSGIRKKEAHMLSLLGDPEELCHGDWDPRGGARFQGFMKDEGCVPNPLSLEATIRAARNLVRVRRTNKSRSLINYYVRDRDWQTPSPMQTVHERLRSHLGLGYVTTLHFMMDLGLPVVKPDRVVNRLAIRLGLIDQYERKGRTYPLPLAITGDEAYKLGDKPEFNWPLQSIFREIADNAGITMRTLDRIVVKLGQQPDEDYGYMRTVCGDDPLCHLCRAKEYCAYARRAKRHKM